MNNTSVFEIAGSLLQRVQALLDEASLALAQRCSKDGNLDGALIDSQQVSNFELAWATAELAAARHTLTPMTQRHDDASIDSQLALVFVAEAVGSIRDRLEVLTAELALPDAGLTAINADAGWRTLRQSVLSGVTLHRLAHRISQDAAQLGRIDVGEELELVRQQFVRFAAEAVAPLAEKIHRDDLTVPETLLRPLREMGVFGLSIPEAYGGIAPASGADNLTMIAVTEALSEASLAAAGSLITRPEILSRALLAGGTEAQKRRWLPRIASGHPLCAIAITEPDYGSDVASLSLRATRTEGGWRLDGAKTWCTFAGKAELIMAVARTDPDRSLGHAGLSILLVEKPSYEEHHFDYRQQGGGRLVGRAIPTIGYRGMHSFDLSFDHFFVPHANVVGEEEGLGQGFYFTMAGMMGGRIQTAARASGVMRAALLAGLRYAEARKVFGAPLITYQLTGAKLAKMAARYVASRHLTYAVGRLLNEGGGRMEASLAKLFACRCAELVTREMLQIHGGMGYAEEVAVSRYFVDARVLSIFEGAEETLALKVIARSVLERALRARGD